MVELWLGWGFDKIFNVINTFGKLRLIVLMLSQPKLNLNYYFATVGVAVTGNWYTLFLYRTSKIRALIVLWFFHLSISKWSYFFGKISSMFLMQMDSQGFMFLNMFLEIHQRSRKHIWRTKLSCFGRIWSKIRANLYWYFSDFYY